MKWTAALATSTTAIALCAASFMRRLSEPAQRRVLMAGGPLEAKSCSKPTSHRRENSRFSVQTAGQAFIRSSMQSRKFTRFHWAPSTPIQACAQIAMFLWAARPRGSRLPTICLNSLRMAEAVITNRVRRTPLLGRRFAQRYK